MKIISRREAKAQGLKWYFTDKPCSRSSHIAARQVSNGKCCECSRADSKKWKSQNTGRIRQYMSSYREENADRCLSRAREYKRENAERLRHLDREYAEKHPEKKKAWDKAYRERMGVKLLERRRRRRAERPEQIEAERRWAKENRGRLRELARRRYREDPDYAAAVMMRNFLRRLIRRNGMVKDGKTCDVLGYSAQELRRHIERQFSKGMTWANYGQWHIDHIVPVAEMIRAGENDPAVINALTNLRPLWARDNQRKSSERTHLL